MIRRKRNKGEKHFHAFSIHVSDILGSMRAFLIAIAAFVATGIYCNFSIRWEQHVGFALAALTFMCLFILQKFQNVESKTLHLKLDEIVRSLQNARNEVMQAEEKSEDEIDLLKDKLIEQTQKDQDSHPNLYS